MNYYNEIKNKLINDETYSRVKDYSKEKHKLITYFEIGQLLNEAGGRYGDNIINEYSKKLVVEVGKKYNRSTLFRMKQLYNVFSNEKVAPLVQQLSWSHCLILLPLKDIKKINYYIEQVSRRNLSKRQLEIIVKNKEYERLPEKTKIKLINRNKPTVVDLIKNPIIINNKNNYDVVSEKVLQKLILEDIPSFLDELGTGFTFIRNEYKIKIGNNYNYIDLLLFNYEYNCFTVIELKVTELKKEHIGQIQVYMNYIDNTLRKAIHDKTIGIIICKKDNKFIMEYCSDDRIFSKEFNLV